MTSDDRFEIRCTPEIRDLVKAICSLEGDTQSSLVRRLVIAHARDIVKEVDGDEKVRLRKLLSRVAEAS